MSGSQRAETAWTNPEELRLKLRKDWDSGRLPAALLRAAFAALRESDLAFPLRLRLRGPSSAELGERFEASRSWIAALREAEGRPGYSLEWRRVDHRQLGRNDVPQAAVFDAPEDAVAFIGKKREAARLLELARKIAAAFPSLYPWLLRRPLEALERGAEWPTILGTLAWFREHPRSDRYPRQIDAPGVHSKFVESRRGLLAELLDLVLDPAAVDADAAGAAGFARRYGLRDKPALVRFRSLDGDLPFGAAGLASVAELSLRAKDFARLFAPGAAPYAEIFVTENEVNFLAFPERPGAAIILGAGYGFSQLADAAWLRDARLRYWGDLDTHGFAILDQFRSGFPDAESFLMDRETLLEHRALWTDEPKPAKSELRRLTPDEAALYDDLRSDRLRPSLRLEQERIGFSWLEAALRG
ncbi:MAG: DUF2220 family protein [Spirochaetaceae bacterium]|nr:DUF2220 family protein [Spirochaetaceae bacterium]